MKKKKTQQTGMIKLFPKLPFFSIADMQIKVGEIFIILRDTVTFSIYLLFARFNIHYSYAKLRTFSLSCHPFKQLQYPRYIVFIHLN